MNKRHDRFAGNILLYDYLTRKRAPVLLNRNLTRALRAHRHLLGRTNPQDSLKETPDLRSDWKPPSWDALDEMVDLDRSKGCFVLDVHSIKPIHQPQRLESTQPPAKTRMLLQAKVVMNVSVYSPLSDHACVSIPPQDAILRGKAHQSDKSVSVDTERVAINPKDFNLPDLQTETNDPFQMRISFEMDNASDAEELYNHLDPVTASLQDPSTRIHAVWKDVLECPEGTAFLQLRDYGGPLGFELGVSMGWMSEAGDSILATHNNRLRARARPEVPHSFPVLIEPKIKLIFVYEKETIIRYRLVCPHEGCEQRQSTNINDLCMHLDCWHDYFEYKTVRLGLDDEGNEVWKFTADISDHRAHRADQRASAKADEPADIRIVLPSHPFDERAYLHKGDDRYRRAARNNKRYTVPRAAMTVPLSIPRPLRRKPPDEVRDMPPQVKKTYLVPEAPPGVTFFRAVSRRPLETGEYISESDDEVDDSWIKLRKWAEFEKDRSLSDPAKRFLKGFDAHMWEERLQSDVHVGDSIVRFARQNRDWIWKENVFEPFKKKIDELLQDGIISQETHTGILSLVEAARPAEAEEASNISKILANLEVRQSSHDDLYDDPPPLRTRRSQEPDGSSNHKKANKGKGKTRVTDTGHLTPITADSDGDLEMREATLITELVRTEQAKEPEPAPYDSCLCGADAQASSRNSPLVACSSMDCIRRSFHYDCIKERWGIEQDFRTLRKSPWVCEDCKPHTATGN
ncbi:hypothetical protein HBI81_017130 [Parastagonospora nodorum]|nr:hypothetical protein HBH52_204140 [Parastagonospora nodorum]KAH3971427.1 hypothetical protein HBH51_109850 [Parastagonospora nodorum]KAH4058078.1 hypothetical protein HBH49_028450 [Parastagonospora nodorum]KAH4063512.1 hypothetical protein HBH50_190770 [Parastagonospora nodorum]KAH4083110.1 hypothetical protein HBH48_179510 [Parastagonospora nodorum]